MKTPARNPTPRWPHILWAGAAELVAWALVQGVGWLTAISENKRLYCTELHGYVRSVYSSRTGNPVVEVVTPNGERLLVHLAPNRAQGVKDGCRATKLPASALLVLHTPTGLDTLTL